MAPKVGAGGVGSGLASTTAGGTGACMVPSALATCRGGDTDDESAGDGSKKSGSSHVVMGSTLIHKTYLYIFLIFDMVGSLTYQPYSMLSVKENVGLIVGC